ncbi:PspC domain-containing protein [Mumia zhuanghuii]|uniref:PspC domain-containing protein n=2 Tax=Mumia TaxID=1546255 RepID=A0ABW1QQG0_9ACTN|nr:MULTISPECIES: PspC domain-containing protein [Mumia]KAA1422339.1 PspC domain-containing protein [Mumia zhuanghuii]
MTGTKKLTRTTGDKWVGGVCGGVARYTGVDPNLVRLAVVVLTVLGFGSMILVYLVAWLLMPADV